MRRCAEFGASPDMHWDLEVPCGQSHVTHRPVDVLLESVELGLVPIERSIKALQWLMDQGFDVYEQKLHQNDVIWARGSGGTNWMRKLDPWFKSKSMPQVLIRSIQRSTNRNQTEGICQMIRILLAHRCLLPYKLDEFQQKPMDIAMRSYCPPHFLQLLLEQYKEHDANVKTWRDDCPESMITWVGQEFEIGMDPSWTEWTGILIQPWGQMSRLDNLVCNLFFDLVLIRQDCKEKYYGDVSDVFEEKVKLLIKYEFIDETEQRALASIGEALPDIASTAGASKELNIDRDGKRCWTGLFNALRLYAADENITSLTYTPEREPQRIHRFMIPYGRNPWSKYYEMALQNQDYRNEFSCPWLKKHGLSKSLVRNKIYDRVWEELVDESSFEWHEFDYDGYVSRIGQLWMEKEEKKRKKASEEGDREEDLLDDLDDGVAE